MMKTLLTFQRKHEDNINITLNHIFVVYTFFLPISVGGYAQSFLFTLMLILVSIRGNYIHYFKYSIQHPVVIAFFLYAVMHLLWLIGTDNIDWAEHMIDQSNKAFYPILFMSFLDKKFSLPIITSFLAGMMLSELISYSIHFKIIPWQFILQDILYPWKSHSMNITFYSAHSINDPSPFLHHSFYSAALALSASILIYRLLKETFPLYMKVITIVFISSMSFNMLIVGGRTGYFLYLLLLLTLLIIIYKKQVLKPLLISFTIVLFVFTLTYKSNGLFTQRIDQTVSTLKSLNENSHNFNSSFGYRLGIWYYGSDVILDSPLFGTGTGDHMDAVKTKIKDEHKFLKIMPDMHNQYLEIILQFGFIGFLILLNIYYQVFRYKTDSQELNGIKTLILVTMLITGITATYWHFYLPLFSILLSAILVNRETIQSNLKLSTFTVASVYLPLVIISYLIEKLQ